MVLAQRPEITRDIADLLLETIAESVAESLQLTDREKQWLSERDYWQSSEY